MLAKLGDVIFTPRNIPFHRLHLESKTQWIEHKTLKGLPIILPGEQIPQRIEISGSILCDFHDALKQLKKLHALVSSREPVALTITDEPKGYLGMWAIVSISEDQSIFDSRGRAKKIDFHMELLKVENAKDSDSRR